MIDTLFSNDFMPHGMCYLWEPKLLWLHVLSDSFIALSYISIPITLIYILRIRKDLLFSSVMALFGAFVLLCGITHILAVWNVWNGTYWLSGVVKSITALVSVATAVMLWRLVPTLRKVPTVEKLTYEINKRMSAEAKLNQEAEKLASESALLLQANGELEAFANASSHDLKSPLRGIRQLASWIEEDLADANITLPEESKEHFRLLKTRISRMEKLLDDLLTYSKVGYINGIFEDVNLRELSSDLFELVSINTNVKLYYESDIEQIKTVAAPLTLILRNLIDNSIKHNNREDGHIWINIDDHDTHYYKIKVCDDGQGVSEENYDKIVKIFTTLKSKDEVEGSGMGLAVIKKILLQFECTLNFEPSEKEGLSVIFTWPKEAKLRAFLESEPSSNEDAK
jgi:signal transduction histidine kinase